MAGLEGVHCNQDTLTGPKGGRIRGSSIHCSMLLNYSLQPLLKKGVCLSFLFLFSLCLFPGRGEDELVSSGEDRTIRVWRGELSGTVWSCWCYRCPPGGVCVQVIALPALSVWAVACMDNGDILSGSR